MCVSFTHFDRTYFLRWHTTSIYEIYVLVIPRQDGICVTIPLYFDIYMFYREAIINTYELFFQFMCSEAKLTSFRPASRISEPHQTPSNLLLL